MTIQVIGTAHCAEDPTFKTLNNGKIKVEIPVYIKDCWTDFTTGELREVKNHFRCVFWGENAKRAEKILKKGLQIFISSAKLRTIKNPNNNVTYTQIWVDRWEVPSKVMMTKSFYEEIYKSELMPYKVCLYEVNNGLRAEVHIDKHIMASRSSKYFKKPSYIHLQFNTKNNEEYRYFLYPENLKFSNTFFDIYRVSFSMDYSSNELESVETLMYIDEKLTFEHTFPIQECINQESNK